MQPQWTQNIKQESCLSYNHVPLVWVEKAQIPQGSELAWGRDKTKSSFLLKQSGFLLRLKPDLSISQEITGKANNPTSLTNIYVKSHIWS